MAASVLEFWFGIPASAEFGHTRPFWFKKSSATDELIRTRYAGAVEAALRGEFDAWIKRDERSALALILLLDQFTRNLYRDTPAAFVGDDAALAVVRGLVAAGRDAKLAPIERWFAYMPYEHSESLADQDESLRLFGALAADGLTEPLKWARSHHDVIARFGRFPHRNEILGRASTAEEIDFLRQPGSRF